MDGVTILNTFTQEVTGWGLNAFGTIFIVLCVANLIISFYLAVHLDDPATATIITTLGVICGIVGVAICSHAKVIDTYEAYEVIVNESVSFTEFQSRYDILEQRGDIFVIKEKEGKLSDGNNYT